MALYRFEAKIISRSDGRSTVNAAAYRSGKTATSAAAYRHAVTLTDKRTGQTYDYTRKRGVAGSEIMAPAGAPAWATDRQELWNEVERIERRRDSQLARDFVISLPHELDADQRRALLTGFLNQQFVARGFLCDIAYHDPHGKGDDRNHHAHVMMPMRRLDENGFAKKKDRPEGNPIEVWKAELEGLREAWATHVNAHLEAARRPERVSHLSLKAQGIDQEPEPKQGAMATQIEREGRKSHAGNDRREVRSRNAERAKLKTDTAQVIVMAEEILSKGDLPEPTEGLLQSQLGREIEAYRQMEAQKARLAEFEEQRKKEADAARQKEAEQNKANQPDITEAKDRWWGALGAVYNIKDPYTTLAQAAMAEGAAFKAEQAELKKQAAAEQDPSKRQDIEDRRLIEAHEYMSLTSRRLAGISSALAGRDDYEIAVIDRQRAEAYQEQADRIRTERAARHAERERQERESVASQLGELRKNVQRGQQQEARTDERKEEQRDGGKERTDRTSERSERGSEMTDAKAEKLAKLQATKEAYQERSSSGRTAGSRGRS